MSLDKVFASFANRTAKATGSPWAFLLCVSAVAGWAASGPLFGFSETWQLVINTGTTIVTFLMVFLIQNTQNRDAEAIQTKLDALILASQARNDFVGIEKLTEKELDRLRADCERAAKVHDDLHARVEAAHAARSQTRGKGKPAGGRRKAG